MEEVFEYLNKTTDGVDLEALELEIEDVFCDIVRNEWMSKFGKEPETSDEFVKKFDQLDLSEIKRKNEEYLKPLLGEYYNGSEDDYATLDGYFDKKYDTLKNWWYTAPFVWLMMYTYGVDEYSICQAVFDL